MPTYGDLSEDPLDREREVMSFWEEEEVFQRSLEETEGSEDWWR